jgi:hypothetical protein
VAEDNLALILPFRVLAEGLGSFTIQFSNKVREAANKTKKFFS